MSIYNSKCPQASFAAAKVQQNNQLCKIFSNKNAIYANLAQMADDLYLKKCVISGVVLQILLIFRIIAELSNIDTQAGGDELHFSEMSLHRCLYEEMVWQMITQDNLRV